MSLRWRSTCCMLILIVILPAAAVAQTPQASDALEHSSERSHALPVDIEARKSYAIPAAEILVYDILLNQFDRRVLGDRYKSNLSTIRRNLHHRWVVDEDHYKMNQLLHPYQGSIYHGLARSAGLNYWESAGYAFAGSALWEIAGERTPPSKNDQVATGIGGTFLGEALFRMAHLTLEKSRLSPFWRELSAAVVSPATGFNRLVYGARFNGLFSSHDPAWFARLHLGLSNTLQSQHGNVRAPKRKEVLADFSLDYGLPGKPGYEYTRPFDYFNLQITGSSANVFESIHTRGLLAGQPYAAGPDYRGVWGLYGSFDYIAPQIFRLSSTALSLGTTAQWRLSDAVALQGTGLAGVGYGAAGAAQGFNNNNHRYGATPQAMLALRLIVGDTACVDLTARNYFVSGASGHDNIARADLALIWRVHRQHAVSIKYVWTRRDAAFPEQGKLRQSRATIGVFYTLLSQRGFGAVDWRE